MRRIATLLLTLFALSWSATAAAEVRMSFHSFSGSVFFGRYPHAFVVLEGRLDSGRKIKENYGFTAAEVSRDVLKGPVRQRLTAEPEKYVRSTNRHFTVTLTDAEYRRVKAEVAKWRDAPGPYYDIDKRNCIHFVGAMAQIAGLKVDYPQKMVRKPKEWLNYITRLNPRLGAKEID